LTVNALVFGNIVLDIGIDGVPLFKKSKIAMYPIVGSFMNLPPNLRTKKENMVLLGLFVGKTKPGNIYNYYHKDS